ncbi:MAG: MerR family transcriptional regulator [Chloroflexi bacterium]|nr:MerR family transcriptional regulator [Chloroflexota bacterium]
MAKYITDDEPCFAISVAARMVGLHAQTLRSYEKAGLVEPSRSKGRNRLYSRRDIQRLQKVRELTEDLGLNLAGVEVLLRMMDRMAQMERRVQALMRQLEEAGAHPTLKGQRK